MNTQENLDRGFVSENFHKCNDALSPRCIDCALELLERNGLLSEVERAPP